MTKKISFSGLPPTSIPASLPPVEDQAVIDAWVSNEAPAIVEPVKRFTFEVPLSLHKLIKMTCTAQDRQMAEVLRELLDKHFPAG